jgi:hypothetical protein
VQYTSRTFLTALADINADPELADKPDWFKRLVAGAVDVASEWENASANQGFLRTALTRRAVIDLSALIDYTPMAMTSASGIEMFDLSPTLTFPYTIAQDDLIANGISSVGASALQYGSRASLPVASVTEVIAAASWGTGTIAVAGSALDLYTGEKVRLSTSGTLPTALAAGTDYFLIVLTKTGSSPSYSYTLKLASTRAEAIAGTALSWVSYGTGNHTVTHLSRALTAYQEKAVASAVIGASDGVTEWQEFTINQSGVQVATLEVIVAGSTYSQVDTLALSASIDKVYRVYFNTDGSCTIRFGDGTYGAVPPAADVYVAYSYGGGAQSNVTYANQVSVYAGGDSNVTGCFNATAMTGGSDEESISSIKKNAPLLLKARSRFITVEDGIALALNYGGLSTVAINRNVYGILSVQVVAVATGGGNPSSALRTAIAAYLLALTPLSDIYVQFDAATLTPVVAAMSAHLLSGYLWATTSGYLSIAVKMFFSEVGTEVIAAYDDGGISAAVTKINQLFATSFTSLDYAALTAILTVFKTVGPRAFGDLIQVSDLYAVCSSVPGIDYVTLTSSTPSIPAGTGYQCGIAEITTMTGGSVTLTQV